MTPSYEGHELGILLFDVGIFLIVVVIRLMFRSTI